MKKICSLIFAMIMTAVFSLLLFSCGDNGGGDFADVPEKEETTTLLVYMCASTLESDFGSATNNIAELTAANISPNVSIAVQAGGTTRWKNDYLSATVTERFSIEDKAVKSLDRFPKANFGAASTLTSFIKWGVDNFPADNYGIVFWDHGGGSLKGVCFDSLFDFDSLSLAELKTGLEYGSSYIGKKFEFVGFDACLMANYETANAVSPYAKTMLASEENEPSGGWDYTVLAENLGKDSFFDSVLNSYAAKCEKRNKQTFTLSAIDLEKFSAVKTSFGGFCEDISILPLATTVRAAGKATCFGTNKRTVFTDLIDLSEFAAAVENTEVGDAVADCVNTVSGEYRKTATGLSIYFPLNSVKDVGKYLSVGSDENYKSFLTANYTDTTDKQIVIVNGGSDDNGKLKVQLSSDSVKKVTKITYKLFRILQTDEFMETVFGMGEDTDVIFDGANGYTVAFEGRWVSFNGKFVNCSVEADNSAFTEYSSPVKVNGALSEMRFVFDKQTRKIELQGYAPLDEQASVVGRLNDFAVGDLVTLMYDERTEYEKNLIDGDTFEFSPTTTLEIAYLPVGYYQYNMFFYDTYNNEYRSDTTVVYFDGTTVRITAITSDETVYD